MPGTRKAADTAQKCRIWKTLLRLLADVSQDAAVNVQDEAVDEVGSGRSQEDSGSAQILSLAPAACGGLGDDEAVEGVTAAVGLTLAQRCGLRGSDQDLLKGAIAGEKFSELFFASCKDEELAAYIKSLLA